MSLPYFPLYPTDFEADTSHLTMTEDGAYNRLMRICWMTPGCSMPADEAWVLRRSRARTDEEIAAVKAVLAEFFTVENGRYSNARLTREFISASEAHEKRKNAGAKGGKAKSLKTNNSRSSNATAKPKQPEPEPEPIKRDTKVSQKRKRRIAEDETISERQIAAAQKRNLSQQEADAQFKAFKNDALAKGKTFVDWDRAFVTWLDSPFFRPLTRSLQPVPDPAQPTIPRIRAQL